MTDFHSAGRVNRAGAVGGRISVTNLGDVDDAVGTEISTGDKVEHVLLVLVRTGDPGGTVDDAGVDEEAHLGGSLSAEHRAFGRPWADVPLDESLVLGEVCLGCGFDRCGGEN